MTKTTFLGMIEDEDLFRALELSELVEGRKDDLEEAQDVLIDEIVCRFPLEASKWMAGNDKSFKHLTELCMKKAG